MQQGNIASQALTAAAKQLSIRCIDGASKISSSVELFCFVLHLLGESVDVNLTWTGAARRGLRKEKGLPKVVGNL